MVPVPGPRQKRKGPTCAGAVEDETAGRQQTITLTTERRRALLGAAMVSVVGEELETRPTRGTRVNVRSNSRRFSPDWLHNAPSSLVTSSEHREQQVAYLPYLHSSNLTARPYCWPNLHLSNFFKNDSNKRACKYKCNRRHKYVQASLSAN